MRNKNKTDTVCFFHSEDVKVDHFKSLSNSDVAKIKAVVVEWLGTQDSHGCGPELHLNQF